MAAPLGTFPKIIRGFSVGLEILTLWSATAPISFLFPIVHENLGSTETFALIVVVNLVALLFVREFVPKRRDTHWKTSRPDFAPKARPHMSGNITARSDRWTEQASSDC